MEDPPTPPKKGLVGPCPTGVVAVPKVLKLVVPKVLLLVVGMDGACPMEPTVVEAPGPNADVDEEDPNGPIAGVVVL